jgi:hypothetical protein
LESLTDLSSYGNAIKDVSGASGPRTSTSSNPLGLAGGKTTASARLSGASSTQSKPAQRGTASDPLGLNR